MADLLTTLHPINDNNTDLYPNVKNENIPPVISGKDAMEALEGDFSTLKTDEIQVGGENGTLINKDQIVTQNKVINLDEIVDDAELAQGLNGKVDKVSGKGLSTNDFTNEDKALVDTIPDKVNKEQGKGLSTNDFTNANKTALELTIPSELSSLRVHILNLYRMVIRSGDMITVTDAGVALASQPFPLTVSPKALLNYVGGMCQKIGDSIITAPVTMIVSKGNVNIYYPIHPDIQSLDGYGWGINADCYNYIDFERKMFVKKVARVDLGSLNWTYRPQYQVFISSTIVGMKRMSLSVSTDFILCSKYSVSPSASASNAPDKSIYPRDELSGASNVGVKDSAYTDPTAFKQAMQGVYLYYELATPVETDISNLLVLTFPTYDIINVIAGGYLEFENENNIGVPYSVTYQYKPDAQTTVQTIAPTAISEVDSNDPTNSL